MEERAFNAVSFPDGSAFCGSYLGCTLGIDDCVNARLRRRDGSWRSTRTVHGRRQVLASSCAEVAGTFDSPPSCNYVLPPVGVCGQIYPGANRLHVILTTPDNHHYAVGNTSSSCTEGDGYYLSDTGDALILCASDCALLKSGKAAKLEVYVACPSSLLIC